jgi:predicted nucleotidyltransferase
MAFLFGSHSTGNTRQSSDVDIAAFFQKPYNFTSIQEIWGRLETITKAEVDLVVLNTAPPTICWNALRGTVLTIKDYRFYLEFMLDCSREAEDYQAFVFDLWRLRRQLREEQHGAS